MHVCARRTSLMQLRRMFFALLLFTVFICILVSLVGQKTSNPPPYGIRQRLITVWWKDGRRMGNLLFNYASLLGIARRHNMTPIIEADFPLRSAFQLNMSVGDDHTIGMYIRHEEYGRRGCAYDIRTEHLPYPWSFQMFGYFQSWKYFDHIKKEVRRHFQMQEHIQHQAERFFARNLPPEKQTKDVVRVGIHVRRGDQSEPYYRNIGYTSADAEYLKRAIVYFKERFTNLVFIVCSDDIKWSKENIHEENAIYSEGNSAFVDFAILTSCQHTIMTVGSFGWWASWLVNGTTLYYGAWPRPSSVLEYYVDRYQYFPPYWIPL